MISGDTIISLISWLFLKSSIHFSFFYSINVLSESNILLELGSAPLTPVSLLSWKTSGPSLSGSCNSSWLCPLVCAVDVFEFYDPSSLMFELLRKSLLPYVIFIDCLPLFFDTTATLVGILFWEPAATVINYF